MNFDIAIAILKKWAINDGVIANHSGRIWRGGAAISTAPTTSGFAYTTRDGGGTLATRDTTIMCWGNR